MGKVKRGFNKIGKGIRAGGRTIGKVLSSKTFKTGLKVAGGIALTAAAIYGGIKAKGVYDDVQEGRRRVNEGMDRLREMKQQFDEKTPAEHVVGAITSGGAAVIEEGGRQLQDFVDTKVTKENQQNLKDAGNVILGATVGAVNTVAGGIGLVKDTAKKVAETKQRIGDTVHGGINAFKEAKQKTGEMVSGGIGTITKAPSATSMITDNLPSDVANTAYSQNMFDFLQPSGAHSQAQLGDFSNEELSTMTGLISF